MSRPGFRQRAAHLSYAAPLIAFVIWLQVVPEAGQMRVTWVHLLLPCSVACGGLFLAFTALRRQAENSSSAPSQRLVAWIGVGLNLALLARLALVLGA